MPDYRYGGLSFSSQVPLPRLRSLASGNAIDVRIGFHQGRPPRPSHLVHDWGGRYRLRLGTTESGWSFDSCFDGTIIVAADGRQIGLACTPEKPSDGLLEVISRRVLPRVASLFGATALHGASLCSGDAGLVLLGRSGAGKSTLTAALAAAGWQILSDDISIVRGGDVPLVEPCNTGVCLWPDARVALGLDSDACTEMPGYDDKVHFDPEIDHRTVPARLAALLVLDRSTDIAAPRLDRLGQAEALMAAIRQFVPFNPVGPQEELTLAVNRLGDIVSRIPVLRLSYPERYSSLGRIAELLAQVLRPDRSQRVPVPTSP